MPLQRNPIQRGPVHESMWTRSLSAPKWAIFLILISSISVSAQIAAGRYTLILEDQPVAERFVGRESVRSAPALEYGQQIERKQQDLRRELESRQIRITGATSTLLNAIFVTASADRVDELKALPGVKAVIPQRQFKPKMNRASALVDAPAAWNAAGGIQNAGAGVKIGIIDTGIDQTHAAFQDSSLSKPAGFPKCNVPSDCTNYTNNKVIVARSYVPMLIGSSPANSCPDDVSARDRSGHGTAVAAIAAGNANSGTVTFNGIAPKAYLGSYKIYGSDELGCLAFTEDAVHVALQDALKDGMDIVNYSSGGAAYTGPLDTGAACGLSAGVPCDLHATDFENAAKAGLTIVASAGNDGYFAYNYPAFNSIETPSDAPDVISVGASTNAHFFLSTVSVPGAASNLQKIQGDTGDSPTLDPGALTLPLFDATQLGDSTGLLCNAIPNVAPYAPFSGIVLIERGTCSFTTKVTNAMNAGAQAVILYMADSSALISPSGLSMLIPTIMISNADGVNLKNWVDAHPYAAVTIDPLGSENDDTADQNQLAYYSSVGPALGSNAIKPDLVAVGADPSLLNFVYSAAQSYDPLGQVYSSTGYSAFAGTSASAPMVAGAAALVKQKHPNFTPAQIKSALVNTTAPSISTDDGLLSTLLPVDIQSIGAGLLDVGAAVNATVTVAPASLSFGALASLPQTLQFQLTNTASSAVNLTIANLQNNTKSTSVTVAFTQTTLTLAAGASATVGITLSGTMPAAGSEYSAFVGVTGSGVSLRIPYMYLVRDGIAANLYQVTGSFDGQVGTVFPGQIVVQLTDDAGLPVAGAPVAFAATGGGKIQNASTVTNAYGIAQADAVLSITAGFSSYTATAGGMTIPFSSNYARPKPVIPANGVVNAGTSNGNFVPTVPIAPGSYVAIGHTTDATVAQRNPGSGLSDLIGFEAFGRLPLAIDPCASGYPALREGSGCVVTVSFDVPSAGISVPGRLYYVSPTQINVLAPWELQGQTSVQVKVSINQTTSNVVTVAVADASPAFFEYNGGAIAQTLPDATLVTSSNPAKRNGDIVLYANGLGPVNNQPASGDAASLTASANTKSGCVVTIGTVQITPTFCGLTPTLISLYQVNIHLPANVPVGNQPITISVGGKTSPASSIIVQ